MTFNVSLKIKIDITVFKWYFCCILIVIRYLLPSFVISCIPSSVTTVITFVSIGLMVFQILRAKMQLNMPIVLISTTCLAGIFSTILNHGSLYVASLTMLYTILECLFLMSIMQSDDKIKGLLMAVRDITLLFAVINLIIGISRPQGIASISIGRALPHFLYGNLNATMRSIMPGLCCSFLLDSKKKKVLSVPTIIIIISFLYFVFRIYFMATGFLGISFAVFWVLLNKQIRPGYKRAYLIVIIIVLLVELFVVFMFGQSKYATYIAGFFSTKTGFSGREALWARIISRIPEKIAWGHGRIANEEMLFIVGNAYGSHNYYLDVVFQRGLAGFIPLLILILLPIIIPRKRINNSCYILLGVSCSYFIMFLMEPFISTEMLHLPIIFSAMSLLVDKNQDDR